MKDKFDELAEHLMEKGFFLEEVIELMEKTLIGRALARTGGNQSAASKMLGIHRNTLQRKMIDYELDGKRPRRKPPGVARGVKTLAKTVTKTSAKTVAKAAAPRARRKAS